MFWLFSHVYLISIGPLIFHIPWYFSYSLQAKLAIVNSIIIPLDILPGLIALVLSMIIFFAVICINIQISEYTLVIS